MVNKDTQKSYDRLSPWYDLIGARWEEKYVRAGIARLAPRPGARVLEIGYGTGRGLVALAGAVGESGAVYGADISSGMAREARARVVGAGLERRILVACADGVRLPFPACSLDAVFMSFTLELFPEAEMPAVLGECRRVLRDGGQLCVVAMSSEGARGLMPRLYRWAHEKLPRYVDCRPIPVSQVVASGDFRVVGSWQESMFALPLEIVLAE